MSLEEEKEGVIHFDEVDHPFLSAGWE